MNENAKRLMEQYKKETGQDALYKFSASLEYTEWLEFKLEEVGNKYCEVAVKYAFWDKTGNFYYYVLELIGKSFAQKMKEQEEQEE